MKRKKIKRFAAQWTHITYINNFIVCNYDRHLRAFPKRKMSPKPIHTHKAPSNLESSYLYFEIMWCNDKEKIEQ